MTTAETTLHLSRVIAPRSMIPDPYAAHQVFWRAHGGTKETHGTVQPFRFHHEAEDSCAMATEDGGAQADIVTYTVQSLKAPNWRIAPTTAFEAQHFRAETKQLRVRVAEGARFHFGLKASVQQQVTDQATNTRRKLSIRKPEEVEAWFLRRAREAGFEPLSLVFSQTERMVLRASTGRGQRDNSFSLGFVRFDGDLVVRDPQAFVKALASGIGSKQAFGFGLLSISA